MSDSSRLSLSTLLLKAGLPNFPPDEEGFPDPGLVIRYFREKMKYVDTTDQKEKCWTQGNLAQRLGLSEVTVRLMETQNKGLDSLSKRRLLAAILNIPPILLGLGSVGDLEEFLKQHQETNGTAFSAPATMKNAGVERENIQLYRDAFNIYSGMHSTGNVQGALFEINLWIDRIQNDVIRADEKQRSTLQYTLWDFHQLAAKIHDGMCNWDNAFTHLNASLELAALLQDESLYAANLHRSAQIRFGQRNFALAKIDIDAAVTYAKNVNLNLKGAIFVYAGLAHALVATNEAERMTAQSLLDEAGNYAYAREMSDERIINFNVGKYLIDKADALTALGRPGLALKVLDEAEDETDPSYKRRLAYIDILRAEADMKLKKPRLDEATTLLTNAFDASKAIKSEYQIGYISRLYKDLRTGPYGNSPDVTDLGLAIKQWRMEQMVLPQS